MTFDTGRITYEVIREVSIGDVNDVFVCRDSLDKHAAYKTIWIVKNRELSKSLISGFSKCDEDICEEYFALRDNMCFVFPYVQERPLSRFYIGNVREKQCSRQQIWLDIVIQCMTMKLPGGVLELILKQSQINIAPDGSIEFGYLIDLSEYRDGVLEKENVTRCAELILDLIYMEESKRKETTVALLEKKLKRSKYDEFIQLFKDIKIIMQDSQNANLIGRIKMWVAARQDLIYRVLSVVCVVLVCIVVVNFLGRLILPDFSFWKLFRYSLKQIGTESMLN
jgi:hypothetical protein